MPKRNRTPDPAQSDLFQDRARLIRLLRGLTGTGTPARKLMLWELDAFIGRYGSITLDIRELAPLCEVSVQSSYRIKDDLIERGLLVAIPRGNCRFEFRIGWARMAAMTDEIEDAVDEETDAETGELQAASHLAGKTEHLAHEMSHLTSKTGHLTGEMGHLTHEMTHLAGKAHIRNSDSSSILTSIPSSTTSGDEDTEAVMVRVMNCGVGQFGKAVEIALAQGMTVDQIHAVVDHFTAEGNSGRWSPNVLYERLTRIGMHLAAPDQGWFGENPEWVAAQKRKAQAVAHQQVIDATTRVAKSPPSTADAALEAEHGATLDVMSDAERKVLLQFAVERKLIAPFLQRTIAAAGHEAHKSKLYRKAFLEAMQARSNP